MSKLAEIEALLFVAGEEGITARQIADILSLPPTGVVQSLDKLSQKYQEDEETSLCLMEAAAENEIGRRQVYAVDVVRYDFRCIRRDECETEPYCQAAQQSLAFSRFRRNDHQYFVLFFQHDCLRNSLKICIFTS